MPGKFLFDTNIVIEFLNNKDLKLTDRQLEIKLLTLSEFLRE